MMSFENDMDNAGSNHAPAFQLALNWIQAEPSNAKAWSKLAHVHEIEHRFKESIHAINSAIALSPGHPPYLFKLAKVLHRNGDLAGAAKAFEECVESSLSMEDSFYLDSARVALAHCLATDGQKQRASLVLRETDSQAAVWLSGRITFESVSGLL